MKVSEDRAVGLRKLEQKYTVIPVYNYRDGIKLQAFTGLKKYFVLCIL